jgi:hypothetical protein
LVRRDVGVAEARRISGILICARALKITGKKTGKFLDSVTHQRVVQWTRLKLYSWLPLAKSLYGGAYVMT